MMNWYSSLIACIKKPFNQRRSFIDILNDFSSNYPNSFEWTRAKISKTVKCASRYPISRSHALCWISRLKTHCYIFGCFIFCPPEKRFKQINSSIFLQIIRMTNWLKMLIMRQVSFVSRSRYLPRVLRKETMK